MFYKFPIITDIEQVRAAIAGREEFIEADKGDYIVFNYLVNFEDTFPPVIETGKAIKNMVPHYYNEDHAIRRECRGLIFDKATGKVIGRRYHKFFNMGEKIETQPHNVDFGARHFILEKLDGSMITPFRTSNGVLHIGTKMGVTDVSANAKKFIDERENYLEFIEMCIENGYTPIFEWCSRKNRIVVDYPEDRLVLTAVRHNETGEYWPMLSMYLEAGDYDIDLVDWLDISYHNALEKLQTLEDAEGYIVRFEGGANHSEGHMMKLKGAWYLQLHKTLEHIQQEKDLIRLILDEKLDDAKPFLPSDLVERLDKFGADMFHEMNVFASKIAWECIADYDNCGSKKAYAMTVKDKTESKMRFNLFDFMENTDDFYGDQVVAEALRLTRNKVMNNLSTGTKVESVRHLFGGLRWEV